MNQKSKGPESSKNIFLMTLGINLAAGMGLLSGLGHFIDQKRGGGKIFTVSGILIGFLFCFYEIWKALRLMREDDTPQEMGQTESKSLD